MEAPKPLIFMETVSSPLSRVLNCVEELITNCTGLPGLGILERGKEEEREEGKRRETGSCYRPHLSPLEYRAQINTLRREKEAAIACCFYLPHVSLLAVEWDFLFIRHPDWTHELMTAKSPVNRASADWGTSCPAGKPPGCFSEYMLHWCTVGLCLNKKMPDTNEPIWGHVLKYNCCS